MQVMTPSRPAMTKCSRLNEVTGGGAGGTGGGRGRHTDEKLPELYTVSKVSYAVNRSSSF